MAAVAGFNAAVYAAQATSSQTNLATTNVSGKIYRITTAASRLLDPTVAVVVKDNGATVSAGDIDRIDYFSGVVEFDAGYTVTGPVTIDADVIARAQVAFARSWSFSVDLEVYDSTVFTVSSEHRTKTAGLLDVTGTVDHLDFTETVNSLKFLELLDSGADVVIMMYPDAGNQNGGLFAFRTKLSNDSHSASVDDLATTSFAWGVTKTTSVEGYDASYHLGAQS